MEKAIMAVAVLIGAAGCQMIPTEQWVETCDVARAMLQQERATESLAIRGEAMTLTLTGASEIVLQQPLEPITVIPRNAETLSTLLQGANSLATTAAMGAVGVEAVTK
jgi:hypothetical protein